MTSEIRRRAWAASSSQRPWSDPHVLATCILRCCLRAFADPHPIFLDYCRVLAFLTFRCRYITNRPRLTYGGDTILLYNYCVTKRIPPSHAKLLRPQRQSTLDALFATGRERTRYKMRLTATPLSRMHNAVYGTTG